MMESLLNQPISQIQCILCNNKNNLKHLHKDYIVGLNDVENYSDMIEDCFNIRLNVSIEKSSIKICEECIKILKYCCMFRTKIKLSQKRLVAHEQIGSKNPTYDFNIGTNMKFPVNEHQDVFSEMEDHYVPMVKDSYKTADIERTLSSSNIKPSEALKFHHRKKQTMLHQKNMTFDRNQAIVNIKKYLETLRNKRKKTLFNTKSSVTFKSALNDDNIIMSDNDTSPENTNGFKELKTNYKSEDEWSTNTEEMQRATGYQQELEMCRQASFDIPKLDSDSLECPICWENHLHKRGLVIHYFKHFPNYVCEVCGNSFRTKKFFTQHMEAHQGVPKKPFLAVCEICNKELCSMNAYYYHKKMFHSKIKLTKCSECPKLFKFHITLNHHLVNVHGKKHKSFLCTLCDKIFYNSFLLQRHIQSSHHKVKNFACTSCSKTFGCKYTLQSHTKIHTGIKEYKCEFCNKEFLRRKNFKEHLKIHYNIKNYKCDLCGKAFVQKSALKGHVGTHYKD